MISHRKHFFLRISFLFCAYLLFYTAGCHQPVESFRILPSKIYCDTSEPNQPQPVSLTIKNTGTAIISEIQVQPSCACGILSWVTQAIQPGGQITIQTNYTPPKTIGDYEDHLVVLCKYHPSNLFQSQTVPLSGKVEQTYQLSPDSIVETIRNNQIPFFHLFKIQSFDFPWDEITQQSVVIDNPQFKDLLSIRLTKTGVKTIVGYITLATHTNTFPQSLNGLIHLTLRKSNKDIHVRLPFKFIKEHAVIHPPFIRYNKNDSHHFEIETPHNIQLVDIVNADMNNQSIPYTLKKGGMPFDRSWNSFYVKLKDVKSAFEPGIKLGRITLRFSDQSTLTKQIFIMN